MSLFTTGGALPPFKFNRQDRLFMDIGNAPSCCARFYFTTSGFGGLGYTPTARACVNISIPLQLRVIDMLDVFTPLLKLFANEPLERLMYTIIIFWSHSLADTERVLLSHSMLILKYLGSFRLSFLPFLSWSPFPSQDCEHIFKSIIHYYQSNEYCFVYLRKKSLYLKISLKQEILLSLLLAVTRL
ncbi:prophage CP-933R superinfection exclusion protein [Escherichia coli]|nr:prophage CP-933R superinfection exclusion protein [Escherichia coli]